MPPMTPPEPEWLRQDMTIAVMRHVDFDLEPVKKGLLGRLEKPSTEYIWARAERVAPEEIDSRCGAELVEQCERALAGARDDFLHAAQRCGEALDDLANHGGASWVAGAVRYRLAFDACWDSLDERHGVEWHELEA
jgi:hypothetical protein